jgi:hypothetical protein
MRLPAADWLPDVAELDIDAAAVARNVYPDLKGYLPVKGPSTYSSALAAIPYGLTYAQRTGGSFRTIAGTADMLYVLDSSALTWTEAGTGYAATDDDRWSFVQWGTTLLACTLGSALQKYDIEAGGSFSNASGSPPLASIVDVFGDFVVLARLASDPFALQWSGIDNFEQWTAGSNLSDIKEFKGGGRVMNISGAAGLVVLERALWQMIRSPGSGLAFEFQQVEAAKGTIAPYSVVKYGPAVGYLAEDGFWFDGKPIGKNKVNRHFLSTVSQDRLFSVRGAIDPIATRIYWAARTTQSVPYDWLLVYDWALDKWSDIVIDAHEFSNLATPGLTLAGVAALYATLNLVPYPLGSRVWQGGRPVFGIVGSDLKLAFFEGNNLAATIETAERELAPGRISSVRGARPLVGSSAATVTMGGRNRLADSRTWGTATAMQTSGRVPVRGSWRYQRGRISVPAAETWTHIDGLELEVGARGTR